MADHELKNTGYYLELKYIGVYFFVGFFNIHLNLVTYFAKWLSELDIKIVSLDFEF